MDAGPHRGRAAPPTTEGPAGASFVAVIGDLGAGGASRQASRWELAAALEDLNHRFGSVVVARFRMTAGDQFQGLLRHPLMVPELVRALEVALPAVPLRVGIGYGAIDTDLPDYAAGLDGPAWAAARRALEEARTNRRGGGVFLGFGAEQDLMLNGFARLLHHLRARLTAKQRQLLEHLLENGTQKELAAGAGVSKQAISKQARALGWAAYREGEWAFRAVLSALSPAPARAAASSQGAVPSAPSAGPLGGSPEEAFETFAEFVGWGEEAERRGWCPRRGDRRSSPAGPGRRPGRADQGPLLVAAHGGHAQDGGPARLGGQPGDGAGPARAAARWARLAATRSPDVGADVGAHGQQLGQGALHRRADGQVGVGDELQPAERPARPAPPGPARPSSPASSAAGRSSWTARPGRRSSARRGPRPPCDGVARPARRRSRRTPRRR